MPRFSYRANSHNAKFPDIPLSGVYILQSDMRQASRIRTFKKSNGIPTLDCVGCPGAYNTYNAVSKTCGPCNYS